MALTEFHWFPSRSLSEEQAIAEGYQPVPAREMPELAEDGAETVRFDSLTLYRREVET